MSKIIEVTLPDIGDFEQVDIIEILVARGDRVEAEDSIITLRATRRRWISPVPRPVWSRSCW